MNYVDAALDDMNSYRAKRKQVREEVAKLEKQIESLKATVIKPDMSEHIKICTAELKAKQDSFIPALKKAVMNDDFTSKWQMRALSAFGQTKYVQSATELFRIDGGAAAMAYMLTGQLDNKVLNVIMPHSDVFNYVYVLTDMCEHLKILEIEIDDISLDIKFIKDIKYFVEA
ncbi:hypothetical protein SMY46_000820 [Cronobacter turicensis]|nr:hypothetical protein [Cronobacter turicensis]